MPVLLCLPFHVSATLTQLSMTAGAAEAALLSSSSDDDDEGPLDPPPAKSTAPSTPQQPVRHATPQTPACPVCNCKFAASQSEIQRSSHVEACLHGQPHLSQLSSPVRCAVCGVSLAALTMAQQNAHVNACLDGVGSQRQPLQGDRGSHSELLLAPATAASAAPSPAATTPVSSSAKSATKPSARCTGPSRGVDFQKIIACPCCKTTFRPQQTAKSR